MRYLFALLLLFPSLAHAQMTETNVRDFLQKQTAAFASCNPETLKTHMNKHFASSYTMSVQTPEGQTQSVGKSDLMNALNNIPKEIDLSSLSAEDCAPKFQIQNIQTNGPNAQFITLEQENITDAQGRNATASLQCTNLATLQNNTLIVTQSKCVASIR